MRERAPRTRGHERMASLRLRPARLIDRGSAFQQAAHTSVTRCAYLSSTAAKERQLRRKPRRHAEPPFAWACSLVGLAAPNERDVNAARWLRARQLFAPRSRLLPPHGRALALIGQQGWGNVRRRRSTPAGLARANLRCLGEPAS